jgi:protoporphyrinogen/coproporphyrinogen III oxidase
VRLTDPEVPGRQSGASAAAGGGAEQTSVAIVGGGITGLALGHYLRLAGVPHRILEAGPRVGGVVRSARVEGHLLEWGPQRSRLTPSIHELLLQLEIADQVVTAPPDLPLYVYRSGKLRQVPFSVGAFLRSDIIPFTAKLRILLEPLTGPADPEESVANYFTRKLGRAMYENVAGPLYGGLYASDPKDMVVGLSLAHVLAEFRVGRSLVVPFLRRGGSVSPPVAFSFVEGMETIPRALYRWNAENVRLDASVSSVHGRPGSWTVEWGGGTLRAERVVVTAPAGVAARILAAAGGETDPLAGLRYNPLAVVHLHAETGLRGLGYQVSLAERLATRGVTFNDSLFQRRGVYTVYLGGAKRPDVVSLPDARLAALAVEEFRGVTGHEGRVLAVEREAMPAWDSTWAALGRVRLPEGIHLAANWESRPGIPGRLAQAKRLAGAFAKSLGGGVAAAS